MGQCLWRALLVLLMKSKGRPSAAGSEQSHQDQHKQETAGTACREKSLHPTQASSLNLEARASLSRGFLETVKKL